MPAGSIKLTSFPTYTSVSRSRLHSLYSDFSPQKQSNPAGYQSNVDWWRRTLLHLLSTAAQPSSHDVLVLHADTALLDGLRCEDLGVGKPLGIASVLTELSSSGIVINAAAFQASTQSIYYSGSLPIRVASYLVGRPLWWALEQLSIVGDGESEEKRWKRVQGDYVVVPLLEQAANAVLEYHRSEPHLSISDSLRNLDTFRAEFAAKALPGVTLTSSDIKILLRYLERDRKAIVTDRDVIKFVDEESEAEGARLVTQVDHGVLEMTLAVDRLQDQIDDIHRQIEDRASKITEQLRRKRKEMAMSYLRSRKQLEDLLSKRLRSLETVQATLLQVESAAGDIEIMKAYETSTMTLKTLLAHPSLNRDKIDETMEAMAEAAADHAEIDEAIKLGGEGVAAAAGVAIDEGDMQKELEQMIEEKEKEEAEEREREKEREREREEAKARQEMERQEEAQRRRQIEEERERKRAIVESGRATPVSEEEERQWEERWLAAQAEKAAQAQRDREAENKRRARWEEQERAGVHAA
ncbi:hypothetical protein JB92DRAFT_2766282 [Gautieria morchelliformis]|nr:hypothetical protein JB92DRAFT_2766282 [Gautieria morchelliformis]